MKDLQSKAFTGRGGAAASMRRKRSDRRVSKACSDEVRDQEVVGSNPVASTMIADEKAARQKNHEKQCVFHGFLLFKRQKRVFLKSGAKIKFYGCFFADYQKNRI